MMRPSLRLSTPRFFPFTTYRNIHQFVEIRPCETLRPSQPPEYIPTPHSKSHSLVWGPPMQNIFIVKKPLMRHVREAMVEFISHIHDTYPAMNVILTEDVADEIESEFKELPKRSNATPHILYTGTIKEIVSKTDLIVSLGGDGTTLRAVSAFANNDVPPVLSFALGTLGFLLPFNFDNFQKVFEKVRSSRAKVLHRTRLECHVVRKSNSSDHETIITTNNMVYAMNDIVLHRGGEPHLTSLDIFIDNELLTRTTADGIVFATPTGSTAYSLSAGGSIVHPLVPCILLTPICPRSLSFRPAILPTTSHIMAKIVEKNRNSQIKLSIDGIAQADLKPGDEIHVVSEDYSPAPNMPLSLSNRNESEVEGEVKETKRVKKKGIWCVTNTENDWTSGINELLGFNSGFRGMKKNDDLILK